MFNKTIMNQDPSSSAQEQQLLDIGTAKTAAKDTQASTIGTRLSVSLSHYFVKPTDNDSYADESLKEIASTLDKIVDLSDGSVTIGEMATFYHALSQLRVDRGGQVTTREDDQRWAASRVARCKIQQDLYRQHVSKSSAPSQIMAQVAAMQVSRTLGELKTRIREMSEEILRLERHGEASQGEVSADIVDAAEAKTGEGGF